MSGRLVEKASSREVARNAARIIGIHSYAPPHWVPVHIFVSRLGPATRKSSNMMMSLVCVIQ
jgi:hypothetical protein